MNTSGKTILCVDDSPTALLVLQMELRDLGFEVAVATNGREAVERTLELKPDLVLLDYIMPELDGIEALKLIRANPETESIPVILVTTRTEDEIRSRGLQAGANDYISKPVHGMKLRATIFDILGAKECSR
jgi:CheY-like chemotaxis protein